MRNIYKNQIWYQKLSTQNQMTAFHIVENGHNSKLIDQEEYNLELNWTYTLASYTICSCKLLTYTYNNHNKLDKTYLVHSKTPSIICQPNYNSSAKMTSNIKDVSRSAKASNITTKCPTIYRRLWLHLGVN